MPLAPGSRFGPYVILSLLGEGGMGEVYRARDEKLERDIALKVLRVGKDDAGLPWKRVLREARAASALNHPNIATIYEAGEALVGGGSVPYIAMEIVDGLTLADWAGGTRRDCASVLEIAVQIADALASAHAKGVVHHDVKPSNVIVSQDRRAKVLDFGLAQVCRPIDASATTESLGDTAAPGGTLAYMSPEQLRGMAADPRSDVFSFGVVLFELLAGRRPFLGGTAAEVIEAILREEPPILAQFAPAVTPDVNRILRKMLDKNREGRFQTMREVLMDLESARAALARGDAAPPAASVAVMTFSNITRDANDDWLGTGIAETVSADLRSLPGVTIIGRERVSEVLRRAAPGDPGEEALVEAGRVLGARWIIAGGFQRLKESLRITARFVEVSTGTVLRTVKIDGPISEIFTLQDQIVADLSRDLCLDVGEPENSPTGADETHVMAAYEAYSKGLINVRASSRDSLDRAILLFERAAELDPGYASALLALGSACADKSEYLGVPELGARALEYFRKVIALRPASAEAWRNMGSSLLFLRRDDEALAAVRRAAELAPADAAVASTLGRILFVGKADFRAAADELERALALNPHYGWAALQLAHCRAFLADFDGGREAARRAVELQDQFLSGREGLFIIGGHTRMGHILALEGRFAEAVAEFEQELDFLRRVDHALKDRALVELNSRLGSAELRGGRSRDAARHLAAAVEGFDQRLRVGADDPFTRYYAACALAMQGEDDRALEYLRTAAAARPAYTVARALLDPDFEALRSGPGFQELLAMWHDRRQD